MAFASSMLPLGTPAPPFALRDVVGDQIYSLDSFADKTALLVMFICRHCPYVVHVEYEIAKLGRDYIDAELGIVGISSNDPTQYPDDAPPRLKEMAERMGFTFPLCFDDTQEIAQAYRASCTPDFYLFNRETAAGLPWTARRQPPWERQAGYRSRSSRRDRCGAYREADRQ